jgi:tetratricopeptide (TPR) repeat protein
MTLSKKLLAMALLAAAPAWAAAQGAAAPLDTTPVVAQASQSATKPLFGGQKPADRSAPAAMAEDIEIMRRLLIRDLYVHQQAFCTSCHGSVYQMAFSPDGKLVAQSATKVVAPGEWFLTRQLNSLLPTGEFDGSHARLPLDVDGTYLQGYGVVFHITMPAMFPVMSETAKPVANTLSDWDRIRKELRGEKPDKSEQPPQKTVRGVDDIVLKCLAENGRHFSKLGDKDNLSVIVAFRPFSDPHGFANKSAVVGQHLYGLASNQAPPMPPPSRTGSVDPSTRSGTASVGDSSGGSDFELLGDLQIKQGRVQEAIQAYLKALEIQPGRAASVYQKLAQAHLKADEKGPYTAAIAKAIEFLRRAQEADKNPGTVGTASSATPSASLSKLVVTAPKSLLDAAAKTITYEEFRKAAHVERFAAPTSPGQGDARSSSPPSSPSAVTKDDGR